ncbi:MAG: peptidase U32 family protein [Bacillota bacterium]
MKKPELLAPAGNLEKLKFALVYGADAVYCGGYNFGLRAGADNFSREELREGTGFAHRHGKKIFITVNMIPHNDDLAGLPRYLHSLESLGVDGLIVSDPGVLLLMEEEGIELPVHLSTQANTVNKLSARYWQEQGLKRIILARELSREEIREIRDYVDLELEIFIHGAMCISYSGRCLLSNYMVGRDANRGECAHSCRWQYHLQEEERPGEFYPVFEDEQGTYILNSRDLCLVEYIPELIDSGVDSLKIEGRMKGLHYVAAVTSVYRQVLDSYFSDPEGFEFNPEWLEELKKVSHRGYTDGFFTGPPGPEDHNYVSSAYRRTYDFMGIVRDYLPREGEAVVEVRHKFFQGDRVEFIGPDMEPVLSNVDYIINKEGEKVDNAPHPQELIRIPVDKELPAYCLVRRKRE